MSLDLGRSENLMLYTRWKSNDNFMKTDNFMNLLIHKTI